MYDLFASADFLFRTFTPDLLDATGINELMDERIRIVELGEAPVGLWSFRSLDPHNWGASPFSGFYHLDFRLRSDLPVPYWVEGYEAIVGYLSSNNDIVRVALSVPEFDEIGQKAAEAAGFGREGVVAEIVDVDHGARGMVGYARTYPPDDYRCPESAA